MNAIFLPLVNWTDYHDALTPCAYMEEKLETTLSELASPIERNMHGETVKHFCDLYYSVTATNTSKIDRGDPKLSRVLPSCVVVCLRALITHMEQGLSLPYIGFGSDDRKARGQMACQNKLH